jgi:Rgg/GadR/MutR family transcriptional activator
MGEIIDKRYGQVFKKLRKEKGLSLTDFVSCGISKQSLSNFEQGKSHLSLDKLVLLLKLMDVSFIDYIVLVHGKKVYHRYGEVFRSLREDRELAPEAFVSLGINPLEIQLFEEGNLAISIDKLNAGLEMMHVSLGDFERLINRGQKDYFFETFKKIDEAVFTDDKATLKAIYDENKADRSHEELALSAKAELERVNEEDQEEINGFFLKVDSFSRNELLMLIHTVKYVSSSTLIPLLTDFMRTYPEYESFFTYRRNIFCIMISSVRVFIEREEYTHARAALKCAKKLLVAKADYERLFYKFIEGYFDYMVDKDENGKETMQTVLETFDFLDEKQVVTFLLSKTKGILEPK